MPSYDTTIYAHTYWGGTGGLTADGLIHYLAGVMPRGGVTAEVGHNRVERVRAASNLGVHDGLGNYAYRSMASSFAPASSVPVPRRCPVEMGMGTLGNVC